MFGNNCSRCKHYWRDDSVGDVDCLCPEITEGELEQHFTYDEPGCPHFEEYVAEPEQWIFCHDCRHYENGGCKLHGYNQKQLSQLYDCTEMEYPDNREEV